MAKLLVLKTFIDKKNDHKIRTAGTTYEDSKTRANALAKSNFVKIIDEPKKAKKETKKVTPDVEKK